VLLSPTKYESYGYTLIEAQSHGIPVIVTETPITRDILRSGAKLIDRTVDGFAEALEALLADPDYRTKLGEHARDNYESRFTMSDFKRRLLNAYDRAIITHR
jgi:glycosyltransferase involved in cell wall biosynthesis